MKDVKKLENRINNLSTLISDLNSTSTMLAQLGAENAAHILVQAETELTAMQKELIEEIENM